MPKNDAFDPPAGWLGRRSRCALWFQHALALLLLLVLAATGCGSTSVSSAQADRSSSDVAFGDAPESVATPQPSPVTSPPVPGAATAPSTETPAAPTATPTPHPISLADTQLPSAPVGLDALSGGVAKGPQPVSIAIDNIDVSNAAVIPVGVNEDLSFEVPPADQIGWYQFGPAPGEEGSSVLAAHIAYNGVDGVFRNLEDVEIGSIVTVTMDDGSALQYRIEEVTEYIKQDLPESLFARDGKEQLALITCGGNFNYQLESYESNTVALAVPL